MGMCVTMRVMLHLVSPQHYEDAVPQAQNLDLRAVQSREHRSRDHLIDRAERCLAASKVEHPIERAEQRIELVGAEQYRDSELLLQRLDQRNDVALMWGIETHQRLIEQQ